MANYRAYRVEGRHRIVRGEWIEASNDAEARDQAPGLRDAAAPTIGLWQSTRLVEELDCKDAPD